MYNEEDNTLTTRTLVSVKLDDLTLNAIVSVIEASRYTHAEVIERLDNSERTPKVGDTVMFTEDDFLGCTEKVGSMVTITKVQNESFCTTSLKTPFLRTYGDSDLCWRFPTSALGKEIVYV